jgi:uncharacterized RDD family membrane protein YckC
MLDSIRAVETPEGITLDLRPAGPVARAAAWFIDACVRLLVYGVGGMVLGLLGRAGMGAFLILLFLLEWLYPVLFEVLWRGQTPGKRAMGLRVLMADGRPVTRGPSMMRSIGMFADLLPLAYAAGLVSMLLDRDFRRLGDLMAGTVVVHAARAASPMAAAAAAIAPMAPPVALSLPEQRAIAAFADRLPSLTAERAEELAGHLEPLTGLRGPLCRSRTGGHRRHPLGAVSGGPGGQPAPHRARRGRGLGHGPAHPHGTRAGPDRRSPGLSLVNLALKTRAASGLVTLVDAAFILGTTRRCLHDVLADTHVIQA